MAGAVEAAFMVGAGGKGSYKDLRIYAYIDDDPHSAFVPPYVISHAWRCENYAKFSNTHRRRRAGIWPAEEPYLYSLHSILPEFAVDLHPNLLSGTRTSAQTAHIRLGEKHIHTYCRFRSPSSAIKRRALQQI
ncbi:hypothetical protein QTP88_003808 [Uroleucon formosanum]